MKSEEGTFFQFRYSRFPGDKTGNHVRGTYHELCIIYEVPKNLLSTTWVIYGP